MYIYLSTRFLDIEECLVDNGGCDQICSEMLGSFVCLCSEGFTLGTDGKSCVGKKLCYPHYSTVFVGSYKKAKLEFMSKFFYFFRH